MSGDREVWRARSVGSTGDGADRKGKLVPVGCARAGDETGRLYLMGMRERIKDLKLTYLLPQLSFL